MSQGFQIDEFKVLTTDGRNFLLVEPVTYVSRNGVQYVMPVGASSDGASTPCELWPTIPPFGKYWKAAFLHDCAYRNTLLNADGTRCNLDKDTCDNLLKEAMEWLGVDTIMVEAIYEGVKLGGMNSFDSDRARMT